MFFWTFTFFKQECIPVGCVPSALYHTGGGSVQEVSVRVVTVRETPSSSCEQNDWQTGVKTLPPATSFVGGDNGLHIPLLHLRKHNIPHPEQLDVLTKHQNLTPICGIQGITLSFTELLLRRTNDEILPQASRFDSQKESTSCPANMRL